MMKRIMLVTLCMLMPGVLPVNAEETPPSGTELQLSPALTELLRAEMRALLVGVQSLPASIAMADWAQVAETGARIRQSYVFEQELTPELGKELAHSLPEHFKRLDAAFHLEAEKLEAAAANHDAQLSAFYFYRLVDSCTTCHSIYATGRFPGFSAAATPGHTH